MNMKNYKIINRKRFYFTMSILIVFVLMISFTLVVSARDTSDTVLVPVYVQSGDTLWGLSGGFVADNQDIRDYINTVIDINQLPDAGLKPGQLLYFPQHK